MLPKRVWSDSPASQVVQRSAIGRQLSRYAVRLDVAGKGMSWQADCVIEDLRVTRIAPPPLNITSLQTMWKSSREHAKDRRAFS